MKEYVVKGKVIEITLENGKVVKAMTEYLQRMMDNLGLDMEDAVLTWLEDEEYLINDEQEELNGEAKKYKVGIKATDGAKERKKREIVKKENPTKKAAIDHLAEALKGLEGATDIVIENETKLITFKIGDKEFKLDLVEKRKPKASK